MFLDETRIPVTASWLRDNAIAEPAYILDREKDYCNADPWVEITGVDATLDGSEIILEYGRAGEKRVSPDFLVYTKEKPNMAG